MEKSFALVGFVVSLFTSFSLHAGNGGSYSGPVIGGPAIPTQSETPIDDKIILKATTKCLGIFSIDAWNKIHTSNFEQIIFGNYSKTENSSVIASLDSTIFVTNLDTPQECRVEARLRGGSLYVKLVYSRCEPGPLTIYANPTTSRQTEVVYTLPFGISFFNLQNDELSIASESPVLDLAAGYIVPLDFDSQRFTQCLRSSAHP